MKPSMNFIAAGYQGRPYQMVASHEKMATELGMVMIMLAPPKNASASGGIPVANMWCTHTPNPRIAVVTVASATIVYPTRGRQQNVGNASETMPIAGSTTIYTHGCPN